MHRAFSFIVVISLLSEAFLIFQKGETLINEEPSSSKKALLRILVWSSTLALLGASAYIASTAVGR